MYEMLKFHDVYDCAARSALFATGYGTHRTRTDGQWSTKEVPQVNVFACTINTRIKWAGQTKSWVPTTSKGKA